MHTSTCSQTITYDSQSVHSSPGIGTRVGEVNISVGDGVKMEVGDE